MKLYQYTAIDEYTRIRFLYGYEEQSTYSSADFVNRLVKWYKRRGITVKCIQTDNGFEFTNRFSPSKRDKKKRCLRIRSHNLALNTNSFVHIHLGTMAK